MLGRGLSGHTLIYKQPVSTISQPLAHTGCYFPHTQPSLSLKSNLAAALRSKEEPPPLALDRKQMFSARAGGLGLLPPPPSPLFHSTLLKGRYIPTPEVAAFAGRGKGFLDADGLRGRRVPDTRSLEKSRL